ncbi:MAG: hypothetical protein HYZ28_17805 [Myxococcales bacterium]|nr:hypothetical protein [Myxococcales bacterium]
MTDVASTSAAEIDAALKVWKQGDCVLGEQWFAFRRSEGEGGLHEEQVEGFVVVTQSCDIVRPMVRRPVVEVSPLVKVDGAKIDQIRRGRMLQYGFVPGIAARHLVADLDRTMTVHKEVVSRWTRVEGCLTDPEVRQFADVLARKRQRFAFPDEFSALVKPLQDRFRSKHDKQTAEGEAMRALREIRVQARPSWNTNPIDLDFFLICDETAMDVIATQQRAWQQLLALRPPYRAADFMTVSLDELTAAQYVATDPLDLEYLSSSGA